MRLTITGCPTEEESFVKGEPTSFRLITTRSRYSISGERRSTDSSTWGPISSSALCTASREPTPIRTSASFSVIPGTTNPISEPLLNRVKTIPVRSVSIASA